MRAPSGEQFAIAFEDQRVVAVEVGGGLRTYSADGRDILDGYGLGEMATAGRGQVLAPWPNRVQDGSYEFAGKRYQLPLTEPEHANAIHGLVRWATWSAREHEPHRVLLETEIHPQPGYPFMLAITVEYRLSNTGLTVRTTATNVGPAPAPFGCGAHPYFTVGTEAVDDVVLRVPARTVLRSDERGIPTGKAPVEGTELDFRSGRPIGDAKLDYGYTDLERDGAGTATVELTSTDGVHRVDVWVDEGYPYLMVFTGDLSDVQRGGLAVEPMTCAPNAFQTGDGLIVLEPEATTTAAWGVGVGTPGIAPSKNENPR